MEVRMILRRRWLWFAAVAVIAVAAFAAWPGVVHRGRALDGGEVSLEKLDVYGEVPDFSLVERGGRRVGRADLLGKVWVLDFIYTECTETCPVQSLQFARLQRDFAASDLRLVSITVDPQHDTTGVLQRYAERYGADRERWLFLTGDKRQIYCFAKDGFHLSVVDQGDPNPPPCGRMAAAGDAWSAVTRFVAPPAFATHGSQGLLMHSSRLVLVDRRGRIRAYHQATDEESLGRLRSNLRSLLSERSGA